MVRFDICKNNCFRTGVESHRVSSFKVNSLQNETRVKQTDLFWVRMNKTFCPRKLENAFLKLHKNWLPLVDMMQYENCGFSSWNQMMVVANVPFNSKYSSPTSDKQNVCELYVHEQLCRSASVFTTERDRITGTGGLHNGRVLHDRLTVTVCGYSYRWSSSILTSHSCF